MEGRGCVEELVWRRGPSRIWGCIECLKELSLGSPGSEHRLVVKAIKLVPLELVSPHPRSSPPGWAGASKR